MHNGVALGSRIYKYNKRKTKAIYKHFLRYSNKFNVLQTIWNISAPQFTFFGNTENGCFVYLQNIDNQRLYNSQISTVFTGKELDPETGYSYFSARYLDHTPLTLWLSVDPMADKYPSITPYAYCAWNPLKLVDPDGRTWEESSKAQAEKLKESVADRITEISSNIQYINNKISSIENNLKMKQEKKDKKLMELRNKVEDLNYQKGLLEDFNKGMNELELSPIEYSFNASEDPLQKVLTKPTNGKFVINYQKHTMIGFANLVHETAHAIQVERKLNMSLVEREIGAYSVQYAFSPESIERVILNDYSPSPHITEKWVRNIYIIENGKRNYIYSDY